ncbi:MAG: PAS domain S-box protein [Ignavibacteria bacterium]|nr:PAS domain S-box protein [Ignavibacteria bacterium]
MQFPALTFYSETAEGFINSWSKGAEKFFGFTADYVIGRPVSALFSPEALPLFSEAKTGLLNSGSAKNSPVKFTVAYKNYNVKFCLSPVKNDIGIITGFITLAEEISDLSKHEHFNSDLQKSLKEISDYKYALDESSIVAITDQKGIIKHVNENFCKISKFSAAELIGQDHRIINSSYHPKEFIRDIWVTIANGKIWKGELKNKAKDGTFYWVDTTIVPFLNEQGKPYQYVAIRADITERKKIEEDLQRSLKEISDYKYALDESSIVAITDQKGIIKHANDNFCKISGYSREELIGQDHRIINSSFHPKFFIRNIWVTIANGKIWRGELKNKTKNGDFYWVDTTIVPFLNEHGKPYQYVAIRSDITSRKQAEEEINELNEKLEARVAQRTSELETLNEELESFSYSISHDLRAPLRAINGYAFIVKKKLEEKFANALDEEDRTGFEKIVSNTKRMGQLIDDLLSFSRLGRKEIVKTPFEMREIVNQILNDLNPEIDLSKTQIENKISHSAPSDLNMMRQVWVNLISNALKYSSVKEQIVIEIGSYEGIDEIIFYIKDNGIGFDMDYAGKLFGVFQRLHSQKEFEGVGVGLAVVKKIIQRHRGKVWAEGKVKEGATFYFSLPK